MPRALLLAALAVGVAARPDLLRGKGADWIKLLGETVKKVVGEKAEAEYQAPPPVFPESWGPRPGVETEDIVPLAGGYGHGSSTLSGWIMRNINRDLDNDKVNYPPAFGKPPFGKPPFQLTSDLVMLPFGYGRGSGTTARWLKEKAMEVYREDAGEFHPALPRPPRQARPAQPAARPVLPFSWRTPHAGTSGDYLPLPGGYGHGPCTLSKFIQNRIQEDINDPRRGVQYPPAFGEPPRMHTKDLCELPFGYGHGSSTLARWLAQKASEIYNEDPDEFAVHGGCSLSPGFGDIFSI